MKSLIIISYFFRPDYLWTKPSCLVEIDGNACDVSHRDDVRTGERFPAKQNKTKENNFLY